MIGRTISHYRITERLGEGGMGVVYKAHDTKLDRIVALKFLPSYLPPTDSERSRFLREAKAASALNHPNVCTIYDIKEENDQQFILMEYVDGKMLSQLVPVEIMRTAIEYAIQIGEALAEAHSKGIVHRDIKTDNIMVNARNQIKVMDFGLAKLKGSLKLTRGTPMLGTLPYMSPEQITGQEVDARSDLFSFTIVLYQMLTGQLPFRGMHEASIIYSILSEQPVPIERHRSDVPDPLVRLIAHGLEKDPKDRYQSAAEMVADLRRLRGRSTLTPRVQEIGGASREPAFRKKVRALFSSRKNVLRAAVAGGIILAVMVFFLLGQRHIPRANPFATHRVLAVPYAQVSYPSISADGNWVAFAAADQNNIWDVYLAHSLTGETRRLSYDSSAYSEQYAAISPDGSRVVYNFTNPLTRHNGTAVVSSLGGATKILGDPRTTLRWRPDGNRIGCVRFWLPEHVPYSFWTLNPDGTDERCEFADSAGTVGRYSFSWSPDGRSIAWVRSFTGDYQEVITRELETGKERQLTYDRKNIDEVCWTAKGLILYSSNKSGNMNIWMVPETGGESRQVTTGSGPDYGICASADCQKVLYYQQVWTGQIWIANLETSEERQISADERYIENAVLSPDRKRIAFTMQQVWSVMRPDLQLFVMDRDGSNRRQITSGSVQVWDPQWSPDGKRVAYNQRPPSEPLESSAVYVADVSGASPPRQLCPGFLQGWMDERTLITRRLHSTHNVTTPLTGGTEGVYYADSTEAIPVASGRLVLFNDRRPGRGGVWIGPPTRGSGASREDPRMLHTPEEMEEIMRIDNSREYEYTLDKLGNLWRTRFTTGEKERLRGIFAGMDVDSPRKVSVDDKELIYVVTKRSGKFVIIEDLFSQ
jgi:serine/threonine protein kinase